MRKSLCCAEQGSSLWGFIGNKISKPHEISQGKILLRATRDVLLSKTVADGAGNAEKINRTICAAARARFDKGNFQSASIHL